MHQFLMCNSAFEILCNNIIEESFEMATTCFILTIVRIKLEYGRLFNRVNIAKNVQSDSEYMSSNLYGRAQ